MTAGPFVSRIEGPMVEVREELHRCISDFCRHEHDLVWARRHRASLWPLLRLVLLIFLSGALIGSAVTFLAQRSALGAEGSTSSRSFVEPSAARAADRGADLVEARPRAQLGDVPRSAPPVSARANSHADDGPAASDAAMAPQPSVLTTRGLRDDPPASTVLGSARAAPVARYSRAHIEALSRSAAIRHGLDPDRFAALIFCESSFRSDALGAAGERGPAQFKQSTFDSFTRLSGLPYVPSDIDDPERNIELAAWAIASGYASHWTCAR